jgi:lipopolysaccharide export system permease protein
MRTDKRVTGLLSRYILREVAVPSVLALAVISFVAVANELRERFDELPVAYVTAWDIVQLTLLFLPTLITYIIPITYMMGILLAFGHLSETNEITAMRAAGISLKRLVLPVIVGGGVLTAACFLLQDRVQPWALSRANNLMYSELWLRRTLEALPAGTMHSFEDWRVYIGRKDLETNTLYNIDLFVPDEDGHAWVYYAESARMLDEGTQRVIELNNGHTIVPEEGGNIVRGTFDRVRRVVPAPSPRKVRSLRNAFSLGRLLAHEREMEEQHRSAPTENTKQELRKTRAEVGERVSLPLACFAVSLVAAPFGIRVRRVGRSYTFAVGAAIFLTYYVLKLTLEPRGLHSLDTVILRGLIPNVVLILGGLWALRRVDRV